MNSSDQDINKILTTSKTIAVVGLSDNPERDSYGIAAYLKAQGYCIIPVNPNATQILGEKSYPDLKSIPEKVDLVNIFRKPEAIPNIVDEAIQIGAKAVWMQLGIVHLEAAEKARKAGLQVVMDKCIAVEHRVLCQ